MNPSRRPWKPIRVLLQTTIQHADDDWHVGRFSLLRDHLQALRAPDGNPLCAVTARDRARADDDPVLSRLGPGALRRDVALRGRRRQRPDAARVRGHLRVSRARRRHPGRPGSSRSRHVPVRIRCLGPIEHFHRLQPEADEGAANRRRSKPGDLLAQLSLGLERRPAADPAVSPAHPLLFRDGQSAAGGLLAHFPAHPHEGAIAPPPDDPNVRVVAEGRSTLSGRAFNLVVAEDRVPGDRRPTTRAHHRPLQLSPPLRLQLGYVRRRALFRRRSARHGDRRGFRTRSTT